MAFCVLPALEWQSLTVLHLFNKKSSFAYNQGSPLDSALVDCHPEYLYVLGFRI